MASRVEGKVLHNGFVVPIEVEVSNNCLEKSEIIIHIPKRYADSDNLNNMISFTADLEEEIKWSMCAN